MLLVTMATVIVDELLCFISNKIDYVTCDELVALCTKSFTAVNIKESKITLFNACNRGPSDPPSETGIKYRNCRGDHSNDNNVKDMITLFQELGATAPKFAAVNLNLIPVVSADKVDVNALFQMITKLNNEVGRISQAVYKQNDGRLYLYSCDLRANLLRCGAAAVLHVVRQRKGYCVVSAACSPAVVCRKCWRVK